MKMVQDHFSYITNVTIRDLYNKLIIPLFFYITYSTLKESFIIPFQSRQVQHLLEQRRLLQNIFIDYALQPLYFLL